MNKLIIALMLSSVTWASAQADIVAPTDLCVRWKADTGATYFGYNMELAVQGVDGLYSGYIQANGPYVCMNPYTWQGGPDHFILWAHYQTSNGTNQWVPCDGSMIREDNNAPHASYFYTAHATERNGVTCKFDRKSSS